MIGYLRQMEQEIIRAFDSNDPVYIHRNPLTPSRKDSDVVFGIGIHNIYNTTREFKIEITHGLALGDDYQVGYFDEPFSIRPRDKEARAVIVPVKVLPSGQHSLILNVTHYNGSHCFLMVILGFCMLIND
jgi:hypothetical protein